MHKRRCDLLDTNLDLLGADNHVNAVVMSEIHANRHGVEAINHILNNYGNSITT